MAKKNTTEIRIPGLPTRTSLVAGVVCKTWLKDGINNYKCGNVTCKAAPGYDDWSCTDNSISYGKGIDSMLKLMADLNGVKVAEVKKSLKG
jgi:hypothetical protein